MSISKQAVLMTTDSTKSLPYITEYLVFKILITLPLKSLLRFKIVCKNWHTMIQQDEEFARSHSEYAPVVPFTPDNKHTAVAYCCGIVLEQNLSSKKFRVRNPGLGLVLDLPDPSKTSSMMNFAYEGQFKLISHYDDDEGSEGCQVLTFNTDNLSWKTVPAPSEFLDKNKKVVCREREHPWVVWYFWTDTRSGESSSSGKKFKIGVESYDVKSEGFSSKTFLYPPVFFRNFPKVDALCWWDDWLVVYAIENDKMKLHAMGLEDLEKQTWNERRTFDLKFMEKMDSVTINLPLYFIEVTNRNCIFRSHGDVEVRVDGHLKQVDGEFQMKDKSMLWPLYCFKQRHTLISFKGMQPQTKTW